MTTPTTAELVIWLRNMAIGLRASDEPTHDNDKGFDFAADHLSEMEAEINRLREALYNTGAHNNPPCAICGYNGPNYYQPETHSCMANARAALTQEKQT